MLYIYVVSYIFYVICTWYKDAHITYIITYNTPCLLFGGWTKQLHQPSQKNEMLDPLRSPLGWFLTSISNIERGNIHHKMYKFTLCRHMCWNTLSSIPRQKTENCLFGFFYKVINFRYQRVEDRGNVAKAQHFTKFSSKNCHSHTIVVASIALLLHLFLPNSAPQKINFNINTFPQKFPSLHVVCFFGGSRLSHNHITICHPISPVLRHETEASIFCDTTRKSTSPSSYEKHRLRSRFSSPWKPIKKASEKEKCMKCECQTCDENPRKYAWLHEFLPWNCLHFENKKKLWTDLRNQLTRNLKNT